MFVLKGKEIVMKLMKSIFCIAMLSINPVLPKRIQGPEKPIAPVTKQLVEQKAAKQPVIQKQVIQKPIKKEMVKIRYGMATAQNKRDYQEDRFTHVLFSKNNQGNFFAIYDGHGGE